MKRWDEELWLFTPEEFEKIPIGTVLECIDGKFYTIGKDEIDMDTRFGCIAFGVRKPLQHELAPLFMQFALSE